VEITGEISANDTVVTKGHHALKNGQKVKPIEEGNENK
jgi:hypothetical protein